MTPPPPRKSSYASSRSRPPSPASSSSIAGSSGSVTRPRCSAARLIRRTAGPASSSATAKPPAPEIVICGNQNVLIQPIKRRRVMIKLHVFPLSPRAFKVLAVAEHLGLDYESVFVDLGKGAHRTPVFAALNPNLRLPVVADGDFVVWDSNVIDQFLVSQEHM